MGTNVHAFALKWIVLADDVSVLCARTSGVGIKASNDVLHFQHPKQPSPIGQASQAINLCIDIVY